MVVLSLAEADQEKALRKRIAVSIEKYFNLMDITVCMRWILVLMMLGLLVGCTAQIETMHENNVDQFVKKESQITEVDKLKELTVSSPDFSQNSDIVHKYLSNIPNSKPYSHYNWVKYNEEMIGIVTEWTKSKG